MEYLISAGITILFILVYMITRPKEREHFIKYMNGEEFLSYLKNSQKDDNPPVKTGKKEYSITKFVRKIKFVKFLLNKYSSSKNKQKQFIASKLGIFGNLIIENEKMLKDFSKTDFSPLDDLPSKNNCLRIENMCRLVLESNDFVLSNEKLEQIFNFCNSTSTITYPEIQNFHLMVKFLLIEKLYFIALRIENLIKIGKFAIRVVSRPKFYQNNKLYKQIKTNNVFLHFASSYQNQDCPYADLVFFDVIENIDQLTYTIFNELKFVDFYDFAKFYTPLQFFENIENFKNASPVSKEKFLTELSSQSSSLNIDEFFYAISLMKFYRREDQFFFKSKQAKFFNRSFNFTTFKSNLKTLAIALKYPMAMHLIFPTCKGKQKLKNE